ncbi:hypothetical protein HMPREF1640_11340 [Prevotella sp. S7-1-8]|nr:hypothetical protein HMPREF1640_11340 [Prevotella sp. S7-1-8]
MSHRGHGLDGQAADSRWRNNPRKRQGERETKRKNTNTSHASNSKRLLKNVSAYDIGAPPPPHQLCAGA